MQMTKHPDVYFTDGCGRCSLGGTPQCKVHTWHTELALLREIINECGLTETAKWGMPCYTIGTANVAMIAAFKDYCSVSFFKGSLLADTNNMLVKAGENSNVARLLKFTTPSQITKNRAAIKSYIFQAIEIEKAGLKVEPRKENEPMPDELVDILKKDKALKAAFYALTPGRQRGYILFFSQAKQSETRIARIKKLTPKILSGKGFHD